MRHFQCCFVQQMQDSPGWTLARRVAFKSTKDSEKQKALKLSFAFIAAFLLLEGQ